MTRSSWRIIVGVLLVFLGTVLLLDRARIITLSGSIWSIWSSALLVLAATAFLSLWLSDRSQWWPLIPGSSLLGWSIASFLGALGLPGWLVILVGFGGTALPFLYVFFRLGRAEAWWALIPAGIIASWGAGIALSDLGVHDGFFLFISFLGSGLTFVAIYLLNRRTNWWALIPGGIMAFLGIVLGTAELAGDDWLPTFMMLGIALVFLAVFLTDRARWWALIPAAVVTIIGLSLSPWRFMQVALWPVLLILGGTFLLVRALLSRPATGA